ncbi:MAG: hypothetical protein FJX65_01495 [Alphaproteobacteria bacterium]|nr:hypothetical protein [Alphaproteobacteria bacterium]
MGLEATCHAVVGKQNGTVKAHLDKDVLQLRGDFRLDLPLAQLDQVMAKGGVLHGRWQGKSWRLELGTSADRWALNIRYPRSRLEKLGVAPGGRLVVDKIDDSSFARELDDHGVKTGSLRAKSLDLVVFGAEDAKRLHQIAAIRSRITPTGALWIVYPKGQKHITEAMVRTAGRDAGLVDVKIMAFSERLTGLKFMIRRRDR